MEILSRSAPASRELAQRIELAEAMVSEGCIEAVLAARPASGAAVESLAGGRAFFFGPMSPLSQAVGLGMNGPVDDAEFDRLEAFFLSRNAPVALSVCPYADPTLLECIARRRYRITHFEHTLIRRVDGGGAASPSFSIPPAAARVRRTSDAGEARLWARTVMAGFHEGDDATPPDQAMEDLFEVMHAAPNATAYLAFGPAGEPAGGGSVSMRGGAAMLYGDATLTAHRGKGLQSELIAARLRQASAAGCDLAIACTLPGTTSQRNYERAGFQVAYTKALLVRDALTPA